MNREVARLHLDLNRGTRVSPAELAVGRSISLKGRGEVLVVDGEAQAKSHPGALSAAYSNLRHCHASMRMRSHFRCLRSKIDGGDAAANAEGTWCLKY
jgi:hypothetical protein